MFATLTGFFMHILAKIYYLSLFPLIYDCIEDAGCSRSTSCRAQVLCSCVLEPVVSGVSLCAFLILGFLHSWMEMVS